MNLAERRDGDEALDLGVIGAGPCGLAVGAAARRAGLRCRLFDRGPITASLVDYPTYLTFFSTPEKLEIGGVPFVCGGAKPTRLEGLKYYRRVATAFDLDVRQYEEVVGIDRETGSFVIRSRTRSGEDRVARALAVVVATGCFHAPNRLDVPGEELAHVSHSFTEAAPYFDQDVLVIGGGNSAVEAALDLYRTGARVTVVHYRDRFDSGVKPWIVVDAENRIRDGEIAVLWHGRATSIESGRVTVETSPPNGRTEVREVPADWVFALTGWRPDFGFLRALGVEVDPETGVPAHDPETMETGVPGIYLAGVLVAGFDANRIFIENGRDHGDRIVTALTGVQERSAGSSSTPEGSGTHRKSDEKRTT